MDYYFIGDPELVTAFRFIGIDGVVAHDAEEAIGMFNKITSGETDALLPPNALSCRVLIITEEIAGWLDALLVSWQLSGNYPLIVEIPGIMGRLPNRKTLVDSIREAIGVNV